MATVGNLREKTIQKQCFQIQQETIKYYWSNKPGNTGANDFTDGRKLLFRSNRSFFRRNKKAI